MALVWRDFISWTLTGTLRRERWESILLHILGTMAASNGYEESNHETFGVVCVVRADGDGDRNEDDRCKESEYSQSSRHSETQGIGYYGICLSTVAQFYMVHARNRSSPDGTRSLC